MAVGRASCTVPKTGKCAAARRAVLRTTCACSSTRMAARLGRVLPMKLVAPSFLALLLSLSACGDRAGDPPPRVEARAADAGANDVKGVTDARATDARTGADVKAPEVQPADVKHITDTKALDVTAADATPAEADADAAVAVAALAPPGAVTDASVFYWAEAAKGAARTSIDVTDTPGEEVAKLVKANEEAGGVEGTLPPTAKLPPGFAIGDRWAVATTAGAKRGKAVAFAAEIGASESHFTVMIDTVADGLAARSGDWPGPIPTLSAARRVDTSNGPGLELALQIKAPIVATAEPAARRALGRKPIAPRHLAVFAGRFPRGFTHLVALVRPLAREEDVGTDATDHVGGLLLADATGKVETVIPTKMTIDSAEVLYLVDLEGDGIDEVIYDSTYYEGSYRMLLTWDAASKPVLRTLGGDGA